MRTSKKPSDGNSPRDRITLFVDRNFGRITVVNALRDTGVRVEAHDDHFPQRTPDETWIELVGVQGWVAITGDLGIRFRHQLLDSVKKHNARIIEVKSKGADGRIWASLLVSQIDNIVELARHTPPPFIFGLTLKGRFSRREIPE
jgi:hypothetical protein